MAEIFRFDPKHIDARLNFQDYVAAAKTLPFLGPYKLRWQDDDWDLTRLAKPLRSSTTPVVRFGTYKGCSEPLTGEVGEFARAYVAFKIAESLGAPCQIMKYTGPLLRIRALQDAMNEAGISSPTQITPEIMELTCARISQSSKAKSGLAQLQAQLKWVFDAMRDARILCMPFEWSPPLSTSRRAGRARTSRIKPEENRSRSLTKDELVAIATAFHQAKGAKQEVATSVLALLCCAPARIEEVLELPADTEVLKAPGQGYRAGIRWWPKKGGAPQIKWVPDAMVEIANLALDRLKRHTAPARALARSVMAGEAQMKTPKHWPYISEESKLTYDRALMIVHHRLLTKQKPNLGRIERVNYSHMVRLVTRGCRGTSNIFDEMRITLPDGSPVDITTHMMRHYLNTIANRASVPQADIALWSGRKHMGQNSAYDHETAEEMVNRVRGTFPQSEALAKIPIDRQEDFEIAQIKETAHTTPFGWCIQSFRHSPCEMFGNCLNCQSLVCIKGATGKLENIRRELERETALRDKALQMPASKMKFRARWLALFDKKIKRLTELVEILASPDVQDAAPVALRGSKSLPQFRPMERRVRGALVDHNSRETNRTKD